MTKVSANGNRRYWLLMFVFMNVFLLLRSEEDRYAVLIIDAGVVLVFLLALLATRVWPDRIWLRGKR
jgi:hypothetical protein